ncbi:MAG: A24 family peptidase [Lentisphaeria bacterium]|nr:MAG: A24 family peptidase [Lentisphaeria bacterium]
MAAAIALGVGVNYLFASLVTAFLSSLFLLLPFFLRAAGAGDVKMLFAAGLIAGPGNTLNLILLVSMAGLLLALFMLLFRKVNPARVKHYCRTLFDFRYDRAEGRKKSAAAGNRELPGTVRRRHRRRTLPQSVHSAALFAEEGNEPETVIVERFPGGGAAGIRLLLPDSLCAVPLCDAVRLHHDHLAGGALLRLHGSAFGHDRQQPPAQEPGGNRGEADSRGRLRVAVGLQRCKESRRRQIHPARRLGRLPNTKYLDDQVKVEIPLTDLDPRGLQCTVKFKMFLLVPVAGRIISFFAKDNKDEEESKWSEKLDQQSYALNPALLAQYANEMEVKGSDKKEKLKYPYITLTSTSVIAIPYATKFYPVTR